MKWEDVFKGKSGTLTITGPDGVKVLKVVKWELRPIVKHWFDQWIKRVPRG